jgi:hypothetical protein
LLEKESSLYWQEGRNVLYVVDIVKKGGRFCMLSTLESGLHTERERERERERGDDDDDDDVGEVDPLQGSVSAWKSFDNWCIFSTREA